jgi:hypothetical protein
LIDLSRIFFIIETVCDEKTVVERIRARSSKEYESNALTDEAYYNNLKEWEQVDLGMLRTQFPGLKLGYFKVLSENKNPYEWKIIYKEAIDSHE